MNDQADYDRERDAHEDARKERDDAEGAEVARLEAAIERLRRETDPDYAHAMRLGESIREQDAEIASLRSALTAEREAHAATKRDLADVVAPVAAMLDGSTRDHYGLDARIPGPTADAPGSERSPALIVTRLCGALSELIDDRDIARGDTATLRRDFVIRTSERDRWQRRAELAEASEQTALSDALRLQTERDEARKERDAAIARAERAERERVSRDNFERAIERAESAERERDEARAQVAAMAKAIPALLHECDECDANPLAFQHHGSTVQEAAIAASQANTDTPLLAELRALRAVREAATRAAAAERAFRTDANSDWVEELSDAFDALRAALDAVPS